MTIYFHKGDLPADVELKGDLAVDTETKGLNIALRDRLCVVQISNGDGDAHLVQLARSDYATCKNLKKLLGDNSTTKIFHFARFDIAAIKHYLGVDITNIFCTKIGSKLARTYTDRHGYKDICRELLGVDISKQQQCSNWSLELTPEQQDYAANDVLHLHKLREKLIAMLKDENRLEIAQACFNHLPTRAALDMMGWGEVDIFAHI